MIEAEFLELLNSAPVHNGVKTETLSDPDLIAVRDALHAVIRGTAAPVTLNGYLDGVSQRPLASRSGIDWQLDGPASRLPYAEAVLEWSRVQREFPGRLRACADPDCNKFLIDHSKPNTARWCSMAVCGNRAKARKHYAKLTETANIDPPTEAEGR